jgi:predicted phage terminase large subunit-like protein
MALTAVEAAENLQTIKYLCQHDLQYLAKAVFGYRDWSANEMLHRSMARKLRAESKYKLFLLPRDHLKSSMITKVGATMRMLKNPDIRILIANNTWDNARKFLSSIQKHLAKGGLLSMLFGQFEGENWNKDEITIRQRKMILDAPTIATTGLEKEQTSQHYDLIIGDDLVARENVGTKEQRQKVKDYINSLMALLEPKGELWLVGTRWSQDDAYGELLEEGIWDTLVRGAYTDETKTAPLFPEKFSLEKLQFLRQKLGSVLFSCWYLNDPIAPESTDFRKDWIRIYDPETPHPSSLYLAVDPAVSLGRDADFSALVVAGMYKSGKVRVVDFAHGKWVPNELVDKIFEIVEKWKLNRIGVEAWALQKTLILDMKNRMRARHKYFEIEELRLSRNNAGELTRNKEARIRSLQPMFEQGLIELREDMTDLVDELMAFPRGKHDDLIDALARCVGKLNPSVGTGARPGALEFIKDEETGKTSYTMDYWLKHYMPEKQGDLLKRAFADGML